jgi:UPF0716 family protein affecting phage T7 exclusion
MFYDGYRVEAYKAGMPGLIADVLAGALLLTPIVCLFFTLPTTRIVAYRRQSAIDANHMSIDGARINSRIRRYLKLLLSSCCC